MRRFLTLVSLLLLAFPAGITITGCYRNPAGNYCNGLGYGPKVTDLNVITLSPQNSGISMAFGQTRQITPPTGTNCKSNSVAVSSYTYGTSNNLLVDISPTGSMCAGTWNRNSGGGIPDFTICNPPNPAPNTQGSPYAVAFITATADSVTSNPVQVFVHPLVTSVSLVGPQECLSQTTTSPNPLDVEACYSNNGVQTELCAPAGLTTHACAVPNGVTLPTCSSSIGTLTYNVGTTEVASIDPLTNKITANMPGTTVITASVAGSGSSAGYFSTCPPASISLSLNGNTTGTVTQGVPQTLVTTVSDKNGMPITGLTLDYQSTNPLDMTVGANGSISTNFPGSASVYAVCQPGTCNPAPVNQFGFEGTGLSIASNAVDLTIPGTATSYAWFAAPGASQYFVQLQLLTGTIGSTVRLPYIPNSMVMNQSGTNLFFGSAYELMVYSTSSNTLASQFPNLPGVVLAVSPSDSSVLVNDQIRGVFYLATSAGSVSSTLGGRGTAAQWTPDGKTLYITDTAAAGAGHTNTLYVYNANTGWTSCTAGQNSTCAGHFAGAANLALTVPGVGAYFSGNPTVARTWCPTGTPANYASMAFYPEGDSVNANTQVLTATTDGNHILGASVQPSGGPITLTDIPVTIPTGTAGMCPVSNGLLGPLQILHDGPPNSTALGVNATAVNQIVSSPAAVTQGTTAATSSLTFVTYTGSTPGSVLPYYTQTTGATNAIGKVGSVVLQGGSAVTAPVAGAFSLDSTLFFVSTSGDNRVHLVDTTKLTDTQPPVSPNLPSCTPVSMGGTDSGCTLSAPIPTVVPVTAIAVKPRSTT